MEIWIKEKLKFWLKLITMKKSTTMSGQQINSTIDSSWSENFSKNSLTVETSQGLTKLKIHSGTHQIQFSLVNLSCNWSLLVSNLRTTWSKLVFCLLMDKVAKTVFWISVMRHVQWMVKLMKISNQINSWLKMQMNWLA